MRYRITHKTDYRYANAVAQSNHLAHLGPRQTKGQTVESHELVVNPVPAHRREFLDYYGNPALHMIIEEDHNLLSVQAQSVILVERDQTSALAQSVASWETVRDLMQDPKFAKEAEFTCYSGFTMPTADLAAYGAQSFSPGRPMLEAVQELTTRIHVDFDYDSSVTDASTPVDKVFELKGGVCQDFAHLQLACLRALGLPSRYVSGYLRTYPPEGQPRLIGADASHAWISVWCPEAGWVDFDPTNNKMIADEHITLTIGRDFDDVSPLSGIILGGGHHFVSVSVDVMPIDSKGNEIGQSVDGKSLQSSGQQLMHQAREDQSQSQHAGRQQEQLQTQSQVQTELPGASQDNESGQGDLGGFQPVPADRTY